MLKHIGVGWADAQIWRVELVERHFENAVVVLEHKIGRDGLKRALLRIRISAARFGIEPQNLVESLFQLLLGGAGAGQNLVVVLFREFGEAFLDYLGGQLHRFRLLVAALELQQQTLLQSERAHSGRVEILNDVQHLAQFGFRYLDVLRESQVVGNRLKLAAQVAVVVDVTYYIFGKLVLTLAHLVKAQLIHQTLVEGWALREWRFAHLVVGRVVVGAQLVRRNVVIVVQVALHRQLVLVLRLLGQRLLAFSATVELSLLKRRILLHLALDALVELHNGHLQQPDDLYLLRRQFLKQLLL